MYGFSLVFRALVLFFLSSLSAADKNGLTKKEQEQFDRLQKKMDACRSGARSTSVSSAAHQELMSKIPTSMMMNLLGEGMGIDPMSQMVGGMTRPTLTRETTLQRKKRVAGEKEIAREENKEKDKESSLNIQKPLPKVGPAIQNVAEEESIPEGVRNAMRKIVGTKRDRNLEKFLINHPKEQLDEVVERILELHECMKGVDWKDISPQVIMVVEKVSERCLLKVIKYFQMAKDCTFGSEVWKRILVQFSSMENEEEIVELSSKIEGDVERFKEKERHLPLARKAMHAVLGENQEDAVLEEFFLNVETGTIEVLPGEMRKLWLCMRGGPWVNAGKHIVALAKKIDLDLLFQLNEVLGALGECKFLIVEWEVWLQKLANSNKNKTLDIAKEIVIEAKKKIEKDKKMPLVLEAMAKIPFAKMEDKLKDFLLSFPECDICIATERLADLISYMPGVRWDVISDGILALVRRMDLETFLAFNVQMGKMKDNKADSTKWDMWFRSLEKFQGKQIVEAAEMMVCIQDMLEDKRQVCIRNFSDRLGLLPLDLWGGLKMHLEGAKSKLSSSNLLVGLLAAFNSYAEIAADKMKIKAVNIE